MLYRQNLNDVATALSPAGLPLNGSYTLTLNGANRDNPTQTLFLAGALTATPTSNGQSTETSFVGDADYAGSTVANASLNLTQVHLVYEDMMDKPAGTPLTAGIQAQGVHH